MSDWPQELRKPKVYGNFKIRGPREKHRNSQRFKKRPGMSEAHAALIRQMPCCVTLKVPCGEIHHLKSGTGERGAGLRSTDKWGVPMCHDAHMEVENAGTRKERAWFLERGIDPHELAQALWANTGDLARMVNVLMTHREMMDGTTERR